MDQRAPLLDLEVEGYRAIRRLQLPELSQVNLFVGKNNVGKTSLLEAIRLYMSPNPRVVLSQLVQSRGNFRSQAGGYVARRGISPEEVEGAIRNVESLFHGSFDSGELQPIRVGPMGMGRDVLTVSLPWSADRSTRPDSFGELSEADLLLKAESPVILIDQAGRQSAIPLDVVLRGFGVARTEGERRAVFVPPSGLDTFRVSRLWDRIAASGIAEEVEETLRTIVPDLKRVYLFGEMASGGRSVALQLRSLVRPVPLRSMGDGTNRVFGLALALAQASGGVVLIDEFENGLHYSVQEEVWRAIVALSRQLNVQVFATTHSWDCIRAFTAATQADGATKGMMHRLEVRNDDIRAVEFTEYDLKIVTRQGIEVR